MVSLVRYNLSIQKMVCRLHDMLVAVDGSRHSEKIVDVACAFAKKLSASIILMYVSSYPDLINEYIEMGGRNPSPRATQYVERAEEVTAKFSEKILIEGACYQKRRRSGLWTLSDNISQGHLSDQCPKQSQNRARNMQHLLRNRKSRAGDSCRVRARPWDTRRHRWRLTIGC